MPPPDFLHQLSDLDQSLSEFPNRLTNHLDGQGYRECIATLQRDQSTWLIEYLDTVSPHIFKSFADFNHLRYGRHSVLSPLPTLRSQDAWGNSGQYVAFGGLYHGRAFLKTLPQLPPNGRSPREVPAMSMKGPLVTRSSRSSGCGHISTTSNGDTKMFVIALSAFSFV